MKRRQFLKNSLVTSVGLTNASCLRTETSTKIDKQIGTFIGGIVGFSIYSELSNYFMDYRYATVDFKNHKVSTFKLDFSPHSIALNPRHEDFGIAVSMPDFNLRMGYHGDYTKSAYLNLRTGELLKYIHSPKNRYFFGHTMINEDGKSAYFISDTYDNIHKKPDRFDQGGIDLVEIETNKWLDHIDIQGTIVHDGQWDWDRKLLIAPRTLVTQNPVSADLLYINTRSHKIERRVNFAKDTYSIGHVKETPQKSVFAQGWTLFGPKRPSLLLFAKQEDDQLTPIKHPLALESRIHSEPSLEICTSEHYDHTLISWPKYNFIAFYDNHSGEYISHIDLHNPTAISLSLDKKYYVVQTDAGKLHFVNAETRKEEVTMSQVAPEFDQFLFDYYKHGLII